MRLDYFGVEKDTMQHDKQEKQKERDQQLEIERLNQELNEIQQEEGWLDDMINTVNVQLTEMAEDQLYEQFAYVTYDDIKKLSNMPENKNSTLLAIRAPPGTKLEIPDEEVDVIKGDAAKTEGKGEAKDDKLGVKTADQNVDEGTTPATNTLYDNKPKERGIQTDDKKRYQIMLNSGGEEILLFVLK
jgi:hypothetical protein